MVDRQVSAPRVSFCEKMTPWLGTQQWGRKRSTGPRDSRTGVGLPSSDGGPPRGRQMGEQACGWQSGGGEKPKQTEWDSRVQGRWDPRSRHSKWVLSRRVTRPESCFTKAPWPALGPPVEAGGRGEGCGEPPGLSEGR